MDRLAETARVLASTRHMDRETWLELRRRGVGSSDAAAVCGLDPYRSPVAVWADKTGGPVPVATDQEPLQWGLLLEEVIARHFGAVTGRKVRRRRAILQHQSVPHMLADLDFETWAAGDAAVPLEVKNVSEWRKTEWSEETIPDHVMLQVQHQLAVTGRSHGYAAVLFGGNHFLPYTIERDQALIDMLLEREARFWDCVTERRIPNWDGSESSAAVLDAMYPSAVRGARLPLPEQAGDLIDAWHRARFDEDVAIEARRRAEHALCAMLGKAESGTLDGRVVVRWKNVVQRFLDTERIRRERPHLIQVFQGKRTFRRFDMIAGPERGGRRGATG